MLAHLIFPFSCLKFFPLLVVYRILSMLSIIFYIYPVLIL